MCSPQVELLFEYIVDGRLTSRGWDWLAYLAPLEYCEYPVVEDEANGTATVSFPFPDDVSKNRHVGIVLNSEHSSILGVHLVAGVHLAVADRRYPLEV